MTGGWRVWVPPLLVVLIELSGIAFATPTLRGPATGQLILVLVGACALRLRLAFPRVVVAITVAATAALPLALPHTISIGVASIVALYTLAARTDRRTAAAWGAGAAIVLTASSIAWLPSHLLDIRVLIPVNYVAAAVAVGDSVRNQRLLLSQERQRARAAELSREHEAQRRVRDERVRIARDLHDVVAHHITLVNAQAGVAHHLLRTDPDRAHQALAIIRDTSRVALDELRATVGLLREDNEPESRQPTPAFDQLDDLLAAFRSAGLSIDLVRHGPAAPLTGTADLAAYRILQEALTNASKHAASPHATVELTYAGPTLELVVRNPAGPVGPVGPAAVAGVGHGLVGMRERAESAGGWFSAGRGPDNEFVTRARLPLLADDGRP